MAYVTIKTNYGSVSRWTPDRKPGPCSERDSLELEADEDARAEAGFLGEDDLPDEATLAEMLDAMEFEDRINGGE